MVEQKEVPIVSEEGIKVEYPIGATISIKGKICKVVEDIDLSDENCYDCILDSKGKGITCRNLACLNTERKDHKGVHFIEIRSMNDMKKIKSKNVQNYVMNDMVFKVDIPRLLKEIAECSKSTPYPVNFTILTRVLGILAERAIEIDDPALNIIMMHLGLYEGVHDKNAGEVISRLRKLIADNQKSGE